MSIYNNDKESYKYLEHIKMVRVFRMKFFSFLFIPVILFVGLLLFPAPRLHASQLMMLDDVAKQAPQGSIAKVQSSSQVQGVTLGQRGDISLVKMRPQKAGLESSWLPNVRKKISSKSAIIIDAETGKTLFSKQADSPRQPASTIKVLTGMIALKSLEENDWVGVSRRAAQMPRSKVYLDTKKSYKADDLINAVLIASANDASVALAEKIAGSEKQFAEMMTVRARLWGAKNTVCRTASGLTAKGQKSTARDLASIFRHAMQDKDFARRISKVKVKTSYGTLLRNHNKALWRIDGAEGGKTGYTSAARQTYVGQFSNDDGAIIVAIMGSETMWPDIKNLVDYGFIKQKQVQIARDKLAKKSTQVALAQ
jgi:D-alanyl-D-alanine carboxypeptidase (penicillin-binding protein 5/6)